ncbi:MAG: hypothetical protein ABFE13_03820 [Phycisphaerales bacterium]
MPDSPDVVLAVLGALLLLVAVVGRVDAEKLRIGLSTTSSRLLAALLGVVCIAVSVGLHFYRDAPRETAGGTGFGLQEAAASETTRADMDRLTVDGEWNVTIEGPRRIVWRLSASLVDGEFSAVGPKLFIDGQPAKLGERETNLVLRGKLSGRVVKGCFTENQPTREASGDFRLEFAADGATFSGTLIGPKANAASRISGVKVKR